MYKYVTPTRPTHTPIETSVGLYDGSAAPFSSGRVAYIDVNQMSGESSPEM